MTYVHIHIYKKKYYTNIKKNIARKQIKIFVLSIVENFSKYGHDACNNHHYVKRNTTIKISKAMVSQ